MKGESVPMNKLIPHLPNDPFESSELDLSKGQVLEHPPGVCAIIVREGKLSNENGEFTEGDEQDFYLRFSSYFGVPPNAQYLECCPNKKLHLEALEDARLIVVYVRPQKKGGPEPERLYIKH